MNNMPRRSELHVARPVGLAVVLAFAVACASMLGIRPLEQRPFEHRAHVLNGIACVHCHTNIVGDDGRGPSQLPTSDTCLSCHEKPHESAPCERCHGLPQERGDLAMAREHLRFSHAKHEGAAQGECVRCHSAIAKGDERLRPTMATCLSCHPHSEQWNAAVCDVCHKDMEGERTRPLSHVVHGDDFLQGHGAAAASARELCGSCHTESSCASCHGATVAALPNVLRFDRVTNAQLHRAGFMARHALEARSDPSLCMVCHSESSCRSCHESRNLTMQADPRRAPHPTGWVGPPGAPNEHGRQARRDPMSCASCHGGAGEQLCVGCHQVGGVGGNPHPRSFASTKSTSEQPCVLCHGGSL